MLFWPFFIFIQTLVYLSRYFLLPSSPFCFYFFITALISWFFISLTLFTFLPVLKILIQGSSLVICAQKQPKIAGESHKRYVTIIRNYIKLKLAFNTDL